MPTGATRDGLRQDAYRDQAFGVTTGANVTVGGGAENWVCGSPEGFSCSGTGEPSVEPVALGIGSISGACMCTLKVGHVGQSPGHAFQQVL